MSVLVILGAKVLKRNVSTLSEHMIPGVARGNMEVQRKKVTKENLEFHVQGQIELTRTF